jgi:hypothetical protein
MKLDRSATESGSGGERGHTANIWVTGGVPIPASFGGSGGSMLIDSIKTF